MSRRSVLAIALVGLALGVPVRGPRAQSVVQGGQGLQSAVRAAIESGVAHLRRSQSEDSSWQYRKPMFGGRRQWGGDDDYSGGLTALALYSLAASGVQKTDDAIARAIDWCRTHPRPFAEGRRATYSASLLVLALSRIDPVAHKKWIHELADRIVESQLENGMWSYELRGKATGKSSAKPSGKRGFGGERWPQTGDNSNTQFAVLALWAAQTTAKFKVPSSVWRRVKNLYTRTQNEDGGWSYKDPDSRKKRGHPRRGPGVVPLWMYKTSPAMTASAIVSYGYASAGLRGGKKALAKVRNSKLVQKGVKALLADDTGWDERARDPYLMYGFERVGSVVSLTDESWYWSGAKELVELQSRDGRWPGRRGFGSRGDRRQVYETSLALLFLSKASARPATPRKK